MPTVARCWLRRFGTPQPSRPRYFTSEERFLWNGSRVFRYVFQRATRKVIVQPLAEQPRLPFDVDPREADRAAWAERLRAAGLQPPQRYAVIPEDFAPPVQPRFSLLHRILSILRRHL